MKDLDLDLVIVGGCGHVGLPLALSLAECGYRVGINDIDADKIDEVKNGHVPFREAGAEPLLTKLLPTGRLELSRDPAMLRRTRTVILVIGTPIDEFMNPSVTVFDRVVDELIPHIRPHCLVVLRSTVFPGTTEGVQRRLHAASAEIAADVEAVPARQRDVEDQQIELRPRAELHGRVAVDGNLDVVAFALQTVAQRDHEALLVLDEQDAPAQLRHAAPRESEE